MLTQINQPKGKKYIYDQIPYPSLSFTQTHPNRLATVATLLGLDPPPVERCRVLELGCAGGGNILPMAEGLPESEFIGIDLAAQHIAGGQSWANELGIENVTFQHLDILDVGPEFGQFDYIITHGVYSWVPPVVQSKILDICKQNLAPNGVAYVSYNTYPGWHMLEAVRCMMLYHVREIADPESRAAEARKLIDFMAEAVESEDFSQSGFLGAYINLYKNGLNRSSLKDGTLLIHDELAEINEPLYFHQFAERAAEHGLRYLANAEFQSMLAFHFPDKVVAGLRQMAKSTVQLEQYMDFLRNRSFRQTLLCHQDVQLSGSPSPASMSQFYVASPAMPESPEVEILATKIEKFHSAEGIVLSADHPVLKAAMVYLGRIWPKIVSFEHLLSVARGQVYGAAARTSPPADVAQDAQMLGANFLKAYGHSKDLIELHVYAPDFVTQVSERPVASPCARLQARHNVRVTNRRHERVNLDPVSYNILAYLDGSQDRYALLQLLPDLAKNKVEAITDQDGTPIDVASLTREDWAEILEEKLNRLASAALLVA